METMDIFKFIGSDAFERYSHLIRHSYLIALHDMKSSGVDITLLIIDNVNDKHKEITHG